MRKHIQLRGSSRKGGFFKTLFLVLASAAALALVVVLFLLFEFEKPTLVLEKEIKFLGGKVELPLRVTDQKSGISSIVITLKQGEKKELAPGKNLPSTGLVQARRPDLDQ